MDFKLDFTKGQTKKKFNRTIKDDVILMNLCNI